MFGGCADGSIIAWNILHNSSDEMRPENMNVWTHPRGTNIALDSDSATRLPELLDCRKKRQASRHLRYGKQLLDEHDLFAKIRMKIF